MMITIVLVFVLVLPLISISMILVFVLEFPRQKIVEESEKLVTFIDLCGHEKYLKTTIFGLVGLCPDYAMILVGPGNSLDVSVNVSVGLVSVTFPTALPKRLRRSRSTFPTTFATTVGFHNFNLRIFNLRVSNPNKSIVDVFLTRCRISMCQGLGPTKHDEISETDRTFPTTIPVCARRKPSRNSPNFSRAH